MKKLASLALALLLPGFALAQEVPMQEEVSSSNTQLDYALFRQVTETPSFSLSLNGQAVPVIVSTPMALQVADPSIPVEGGVAPAPAAVVAGPQIDLSAESDKAFRYSLIPTLIGFGGAAAFSTIGNATQNRAFFALGTAFGLTALVGPSVGHFYAGDTARGTRLLLRRLLIPGLLAVGGGTAAVVGGLTLVESDGEQGAGLLLAGAGVFLSAAVIDVVMSIRHVADARQAPERVAQKRGALSIAPVPVRTSDPSERGAGLALSGTF